MQVFVTGGSGFLGRALIRALVARGDLVLALARSDTAAETVSALGARAVRGDLFDAVALGAGLAGCECLFHCAATVEEWGPKALYQRVNVEGSKTLLVAAQAAGVARFVLVSTEAVYAGAGPLTGLDESRPLPEKPLPRYPLSKNLAERAVLAANRPGFATVACRPRLIWGEGDSSVLPKLVAAVREGRFAWVDGGRYPTQTCHVENVVEGLLLAAEHGRGGEAYFLTDGEPVEFRAFFTAWLGSQGLRIPDKSVPFALALGFATVAEWLWEYLPLPGAPPVTRIAVRLGGQAVTISDAKARRELGYRGHVSRQAGLAAMKKARPLIGADGLASSPV